MVKRTLKIVAAVLCIFVISVGLIGFVEARLINLKDSKQSYAEKLLKLKTQYVGDHNKVITIIDNLPWGKSRRTFELSTKKAPYGVKVYYDLSNTSGNLAEIAKSFLNNAVVLLALIDNADVIEYSLDYGSSTKEQYRYTRAQLQQSYEKDLRAYTKDVKIFDRLLKSLDMKFTVKPDKYALIMSSTPGMQISTQYKGKADKVGYSTSYGRFFGWNKTTGKMDEYSSSVEVPLNTSLYWSPLGTPPENGVKNIPIKVTVYSGKVSITEKLINVKYDGKLYYTVDTAVL